MNSNNVSDLRYIYTYYEKYSYIHRNFDTGSDHNGYWIRMCEQSRDGKRKGNRADGRNCTDTGQKHCKVWS